MKRGVNLNLEHEVVMELKKRGINISKLVNDYLKNYIKSMEE